MKEADRTALATVRQHWVNVRAEIEAARGALNLQVAELKNPETWQCREADRVLHMLREARLGLTNRINEADVVIARIDATLRVST